MTKEIKEVIELLEKVHKQLPASHIYEYVDQALALLRKTPEPTKWTVFIEHLELSQKLYCLEYDDRRIANITKEQFESFEILLRNAPKQPPAGEFTKELRKRVTEYRRTHSPLSHIPYTVSILNQAEQACDRLDASEASRKNLLDACKGLMEKADNGSADFDDPAPGSIYLKAEAAIAREKEGKRK